MKRLAYKCSLMILPIFPIFGISASWKLHETLFTFIWVREVRFGYGGVVRCVFVGGPGVEKLNWIQLLENTQPDVTL